MARASVPPYDKSFVMIIDSKMQTIDLGKLRREIAEFLASRPAPRSTGGTCRTIIGPGNVILCSGDCRRAGESCEPKRVAVPGGHVYRCSCQRPITQPVGARRAKARRPAARRVRS
jgi:hypothetical protein